MPKDTPFTDAQVAEQLRQLPGWSVESGMLARRYATDGWPTTLMLVNAIGFLAEAADHHPDILVHGWNRLRLSLSTHSQGRIPQADLDMARRLNALGG